MNILQIVTKLDTGDRAQDVITSTRLLTLNGHKIVVVSQKSVSVKEIDEVGARHYPVTLKPNIFTIIIAVYKLSKIITRENVDIVHARDPLSSFIAFFSARLTDRVFVSTVYEGRKGGILCRAQFWAKRIMCLSENQARQMVNDGLVPQGKVCAIPPFIDETRLIYFRPALKGSMPSQTLNLSDYFVIGALVPLRSEEAVHYFVKIVSIFSRTVYKVKIFVTDSAAHHEKDAMEKLKLLIKRHSLDTTVSFLTHGEKISLLADLNLFLQINADGSLPVRQLLYAQARGIPVITTYVSGIEHYTRDGQTAIVCKDAKPQDVATEILALYKNKKLKEKMAAEATRFMREAFNSRQVMDSALRFYADTLSSKYVLIIKIQALGDVILSVPSIRAVREKFPHAVIKVLVGIHNSDAVANCPFIDDIIVCDFKGRDKGLAGLLRLGRRLRSEGPDMVIDLQNNKKSHMLAFLSCAPKRYGYDNGKYSFLLNRKAKETTEIVDPVEHQSRVLSLIGIHNVNKKLELWPFKEDEQWAESFLKSQWITDGAKLVAFNIGSSQRWITKLWPVSYFAETCNALAKNFGIRVVLIGAEKKNARIEEFLRRAKCKPIRALGKTSIPRLAALIKKCDLLLSPDSAPMHVAAAVGTPFVALFGPTDPRRHVLPADNCVIFRKDLACSPCYHTYCNKKYACMYSIKPEGVYKAILKLLDIGNKGSKTEFLATKPDSSRPGKTKNMMNSDLTAADGA